MTITHWENAIKLEPPLTEEQLLAFIKSHPAEMTLDEVGDDYV